jgi:phosphoglycolate phosphatase-like HAD superfamily hydrolase
MRHSFRDYATVVFDCDGVVLDSNRIKTQAFYDTVVGFGPEAADRLVEYHKANGGVSRFKKFDYFLSEVVRGKAGLPSRDELVARYADHVRQGLLSSRVEPTLGDLRSNLPDQHWLIVSGGAQDELRWVFKEKKIEVYFDGGIYGSPDPKEEILEREISRNNILSPALFIGDSKYDYLAAKGVDMDFLFISQWTEFSEWQSFCRSHDIPVLGSLKELRE